MEPPRAVKAQYNNPMFERVSPRLLKAEPMRRCRLEECRAACCLYGVWIDLREAKDLLDNAALIIPHMPAGQEDPTSWFDGREESDPHSPSGRVIHSAVLEDPAHYGGTACGFLRPDHKCALQAAADGNGMHPWRFKPFYCILHPLDLDEEGRITLDETDALLAEPSSCLRPSEDPVPLADTFEPELRYLLGERTYGDLRRQAGSNNPQG